MSESRKPMTKSELVGEIERLCNNVATELAHAQHELIKFKAQYDALIIKANNGRTFPHGQLDDDAREIVFDSLASHPAKAKDCLHDALREIEAARFCGAVLINASEVCHA